MPFREHLFFLPNQFCYVTISFRFTLLIMEDTVWFFWKAVYIKGIGIVVWTTCLISWYPTRCHKRGLDESIFWYSVYHMNTLIYRFSSKQFCVFLLRCDQFCITLPRVPLTLKDKPSLFMLLYWSYPLYLQLPHITVTHLILFTYSSSYHHRMPMFKSFSLFSLQE